MTLGPPDLPGRWQLVFGDDFDGPGVDPGRWRCNRFGGSGEDAPFNPEIEAAFFSPANVSVRDGAAVLRVAGQERTIDGRTYRRSSGTLSTEGLFDSLDGDFLEARLRVPGGAGLWPAFWTVPSGRWPPETDVVEFFDTATDRRPAFNHHFVAGGQSGPAPYGDPAVDHRDGWHVYGLHRARGALVPWVDGRPHPGAGVAAGADDLPHFLVLNLSVRDVPSPPSDAEMLVDWVRVWRPC